MNDVLVKKIPLNSKRDGKYFFRNASPFKSNKRKAQNIKYEKKPLMALDSDNSDEEVILHDIRHLKKPSKGTCGASSLRNLKKLDVTSSNGVILNNSNPSDPFFNCDFLDLKIEDGDTLQSISIKYQCAISDIKRANNLISDQDFFALKHLKIPVKKYSLLTEILPPLLENEKASTFVEEHESDTRTISIGIGSAGRSPSPQEAAAFFKRMDEDLVKIMLSTNSQKDSLEAATVVLTTPQIQPLVKDPYIDCGIQWNYLITFIIIIAIVIPCVIALYMYMRSSHETHSDVYSSSSSERYDSVSKLNMKPKS